MPLQKPSSTSISRSKRVRCSMRWAFQPACTAFWKNVDALPQFDLDRFDRAQRGRARRHVVARRVHREARHRGAAPGPSADRTLPAFRFRRRTAICGSHALACFRRGRHRSPRRARGRCRGGNPRSLRSGTACRPARRAMTSRCDIFLASGAGAGSCAWYSDGIADAVDRRHRGDDHHVAAAPSAIWWPTGASARCAR